MTRGGPVSLLLLAVVLVAGLAQAGAAQTLTIADRVHSKELSTQALLADPAAQTITVSGPVYHRPMTYRAIPVADLLKGLQIGDDDYIQARATDNFSVGIPARLLKGGQGAAAEAFLAIEDPKTPWPAIPGKTDGPSAGPFFLVWRIDGKADVSSEYWAYHLAALTAVDSPYKRWPALAVANSVPATDPVRRGLDRFVAFCLPCHRFAGAGEGTQGPDLATPMNPVDYIRPEVLHQLIRNSASVRAWPAQTMSAFSPETLPDEDINAIIAWLAYKKAERK